MSLNMVGIGDLHLDGKLKKHLPNLNHLIMDEVRKVMYFAERNGVDLVVFYGDICETPNLSKEATNLLIQFIYQYPRHRLVFMTGNHDVENSEHHSLQVLKTLSENGAFPNVKIIDSPKTLMSKSGTPLRILPWPSLDTRKNCLNVIHTEVKGAFWDHGRAVDSTNMTNHYCVGGHLHTKQKINKVHFSGTLYQTSFGEKQEKFFHHVTWNDGEPKPNIRAIRHYPEFKLTNLVVRSQEDLDQIEDNPLSLYKVYVHSDMTMDADVLHKYPNIVKHNSFKTKSELRVLIQEEIMLDEGLDQSALISNADAMKQWLTSRKDLDDSMRRRVFKKFKSYSKV